MFEFVLKFITVDLHGRWSVLCSPLLQWSDIAADRLITRVLPINYGIFFFFYTMANAEGLKHDFRKLQESGINNAEESADSESQYPLSVA